MLLENEDSGNTRVFLSDIDPSKTTLLTIPIGCRPRQNCSFGVGGAPVAQWVKRWPTDFKPRSRRNLLNCKRGYNAHSLSLSSVHCPDMTEILLKRT